MSESRDLIHRMVQEKCVLKQDVFQTTHNRFLEMRELLNELLAEIEQKFGPSDERVTFHIKDKGDFQTEMKIAGDLLIIQMHTNVFQFDHGHSLWKSGYLKDDPNNSFVGVINIYNFLSDSFKYQRLTDVGYLIGRVFINHENHFLVQGKKQLGYLFNDFVNSVLDKENLKRVLETSILHALDFDLLIPPYENIQIVSVEEMQSMNHSHVMATGKRLGFQFGIDREDP